MQISVRPAVSEDIQTIVALYGPMEAEQTVRKPVWALADALDQPYEASLDAALNASDSWLYVGLIDDATVGFLWVTIESMLERAHGERIGRIRLIYTMPEARGVGVGDAMLDVALTGLRELGIRYFDAPVGPGQRVTKNFFEGHGFAARSIVMHHADAAGEVSDD